MHGSFFYAGLFPILARLCRLLCHGQICPERFDETEEIIKLSTKIIVILVLILVIIGLIYYGVYYLKKKTREFSRQVFGTDSLKEGFDTIESEYATTPKSVSAMTSLYLPRITKDFPDFSYDEMKTKAVNVLTSFLLGLATFDVGALTEGNSELKNKLENTINIWKTKSQKPHFDSIKVHRTELSNYTKKDGRCIITFQSSVQYYQYVTDDVTHQIVGGSKDVLYQSKYEIDLVYIQNRSLLADEHIANSALGVNCPNCGAPITNLGAKFCEYCGTGVVEVNIHAWDFDDVREIRR